MCSPLSEDRPVPRPGETGSVSVGGRQPQASQVSRRSCERGGHDREHLVVRPAAEEEEEAELVAPVDGADLEG